MIKAQQGWERRKHTAPTFQTGDQVWLDGRNIKTFHPTAKLVPKHHGVTSQRLILLDLSVFGYLVFNDSFPSGAS
jgi:hypothetical protein